MGFFTFLTGEQEQPNPEGWKVRRKGKDYWEVNPDTPAGPEDEITREDQTPIAGADEMKSYSQRRGEATANVLSVADRVIQKFESSDPASLKPLADQARRDIRTNPDDAAKIIEKFFKKATGGTSIKTSGSTDPWQIAPAHNLYDSDFSALEGHVRGLRSMKRGPAEQSLTGALKETDLKKNLSELQNLKGQLDTLTKEIATAKDTMPEAVSARGEQEQKNIVGAKQQKAAALAEHIKQLEAMTAGQQPVQVNAPPAVPPTVETPPQFLGPISHFMDGLGIPSEQLPAKVHAALNAVGISPDQWADTNVEPTAGLMRVLGEMDKDGAFAQLIVQQMSLARQQDMTDQQNQPQGQSQPTQQQSSSQGQQGNPAIARTEGQIRSREQEIRQLYSQLRQSPFMQTWPGIILYVLVGMLTQNPAFAARLIGGVGNRDAIDREIKGIQFELRRLDGQLARQEREEAYSKREAARRLQHKDDVADQRKWEMSKMMVQHNLIIQRNAARGNPETFIMKKLAGDFQRSLGMASKFQGEMDQYARAMNNELADPKSREDARRKWSDAKRNYDYYMQKAAGVDQDIRGIGGAAAAPEEDSEE